ncbi:MAG: DUF1622 domain-containing protein [Sphingobacteriales bacterium]|nr:MAG: DUF1622 domain-containing protein [Sphingobacteriales bacterium]
MEEFVKTSAHYAGSVIEFIAALIIAYACLKAFVTYIIDVFSNSGSIVPKNEIRLTFGRSLVLALEFLLAADILQTAVAPTWDEIGKLAAIAAIRTVLNYFLEHELGEMKEKKSGNAEM